MVTDALCEHGAYVDQDYKSKQYTMLVHPCDEPPMFKLFPAGRDEKLTCSTHMPEDVREALNHDPMVVVRRMN